MSGSGRSIWRRLDLASSVEISRFRVPAQTAVKRVWADSNLVAFGPQNRNDPSLSQAMMGCQLGHRFPVNKRRKKFSIPDNIPGIPRFHLNTPSQKRIPDESDRDQAHADPGSRSERGWAFVAFLLDQRPIEYFARARQGFRGLPRGFHVAGGIASIDDLNSLSPNLRWHARSLERVALSGVWA